MNIDVNHNVCANNRSFLHFGHFLVENILSVNLKISVGHYGILLVMTRFILMHSLKFTSYIQLDDQKIKTLNVTTVMRNSPKANEKKFGLSVSAVQCGATGMYRSRKRRVYL